jgi:uncharacterized protein
VAGQVDAISVDEVLSEAVKLLIDRFTPTKIILFGSRARGEATDDSDLDLLVVMPDGTDRRQAAVQIHRHLRDLPLAKDVLVITPSEIAGRGSLRGGAVSAALNEGKVLYERS